MTIIINKIDDDTFSVSISSVQNTQHTVKLTDKQVELYKLGNVNKEEVVEFAFGFLLEREPNTSILPTFPIELIGNYFPEFEGKLQQYLK